MVVVVAVVTLAVVDVVVVVVVVTVVSLCVMFGLVVVVVRDVVVRVLVPVVLVPVVLDAVVVVADVTVVLVVGARFSGQASLLTLTSRLASAAWDNTDSGSPVMLIMGMPRRLINRNKLLRSTCSARAVAETLCWCCLSALLTS